MKLASYNDGSRDGALVVVSRDLKSAHYATGIATRLQQVLDDWNFLSPQLQDLYVELNHGRARHAFDFEPARCMAPLPRAYQRLQAQAYPEHAALARLAGGAVPTFGPEGETPAAAPRRAPLSLRQAAGDNLLGAHEPIVASREAMQIDFGAQVAAFTADVRHGSTVEQGLEAVRLLALLNTPCLRALAQREGGEGGEASEAGGLADVLAWPGAAFSPVAVTPDELGEAWRGGRVHLTLQCHWNGRRVGLLEAGADLSHHFGQIVSQAVQTRHLRAGTVIGLGVACNRRVEKKGRAEWPSGYASIAARRGMELLQDGAASTAFLQFGDTLRIEMKGTDGHSVFGAIEQEVISWQTHAARTRAAEQPSRDVAGDGGEDDEG
ncbi:MAG: fumarylacetoacetate hydrolase family protein [Comamonas sp.]